jgi:regulator of sigma E protease
LTGSRASTPGAYSTGQKEDKVITALYILLALFIFGVMILVHELGHYTTARLCGVGVKEFSIGMGPRILSRTSKKNNIRYSLRLLPIGGSVSMVGEDEESDAEDAFDKISVPRRMLIIVSGALMNLLLGFLIMFIIVLSSTPQLSSNVVAQFKDGAMSSESGLMVGDRIVRVGKVRVHTGYDLAYEIMNQGSRPVDLTVIRQGEKIMLRDVLFPGFTEANTAFGDLDFYVYGEAKTFGSVIKHTWYRSIFTIKMVWDSLLGLIGGRYGFEMVSGPVGITKEIEDAARTGVTNLLFICAMISINLGVVNLLPLPALDGGRLVFLIVEAVRGKPVNKNIEAYIHFIGIILLFTLMIIITMKDVRSIIRQWYTTR